MYIAINSIDNGYVVEITKYKKVGIDYFGTKIKRFFPTPEAVQAELLKLIKEAS